MRYLLDSDTFIAAKNLYYRPDFCQNFWEWIKQGYLNNKVFSIDVVYKELNSGYKTDFLYQWVNEFNPTKGFFLETSGSLSKWQQITDWVASRKYKESAKNKFFDPSKADVWLIAYVLLKGVNNYTIVTNEKPEPNSLRSIKLPDVAEAMNIPIISLYDLLSKHGANNFCFKP